MLSNHRYYSFDYKKEIDRLIIFKDSLNQSKNPYSNKGKKMKEHLKDGLVESVVELVIHGLSLGDLEEQRQEDEEDWDYNRTESLNSINSQFSFWKNSALKEIILAPNDTIEVCFFQ